jgi:hypothetical protein
LATINDRVLASEIKVEGFIIEQIKPTSVTVRRAGFREAAAELRECSS